MDKIIYKEEQRFPRFWLWFILVISFGAPIVILLTQMKVEAEADSKEVMLLVFVLFFILVVGGLLCLLFLKTRLIIEITQMEIKFRYPPFILKWKIIEKREIERFVVKKYKPIAEYGGWGIKTKWKKRNMAYNISGNIGLLLYLKSGKSILLGTQRKQAIKYAMDKMLKENE